jgi:hypothetical protein
MPYIGRLHVFQALALPIRGAVHENVDPLEERKGLIDQRMDGTLVGKVRLKSYRLNAAGVKGLDGFRRFRRRSVVMDDQRVTPIRPSPVRRGLATRLISFNCFHAFPR